MKNKVYNIIVEESVYNKLLELMSRFNQYTVSSTIEILVNKYGEENAE